MPTRSTPTSRTSSSRCRCCGADAIGATRMSDAVPARGARGLARRFGDVHRGRRRHDATSGPGEVVGLLGANGAGKTTLIRHAARPAAADARRGRAARRCRRTASAARGSATCRRASGLYRDLTVRENLAFAAPGLRRRVRAAPELAARRRPTARRATCRSACSASWRSSPRWPTRPQRARARRADVRRRPARPGGAVGHDPRAGRRAASGVLVTTHYMQEAEQCDRLLLMSRARLVAQGSEADIIGDTTAAGGAHRRLGARRSPRSTPPESR